MQTDLKMQNEIKTVWICFAGGGLWCSAKLTVTSKHLLSSFDNTVFSLKNRFSQRLFSSKYLFEELDIDSKFP